MTKKEKIAKLRNTRDKLWKSFCRMPRRESFSGLHVSEQINKIQQSLEKACSKAEPELITELTKRIEQKILSKKTNQVKTSLIGKLVLQELKAVDKIACLRYATVHKKIADPKLLEKELKIIA